MNVNVHVQGNYILGDCKLTSQGRLALETNSAAAKLPSLHMLLMAAASAALLLAML